jgi:hypothetical protein
MTEEEEHSSSNSSSARLFPVVIVVPSFCVFVLFIHQKMRWKDMK